MEMPGSACAHECMETASEWFQGARTMHGRVAEGCWERAVMVKMVVDGCWPGVVDRDMAGWAGEIGQVRKSAGKWP